MELREIYRQAAYCGDVTSLFTQYPFHPGRELHTLYILHKQFSRTKQFCIISVLDATSKNVSRPGWNGHATNNNDNVT
jgi:hypothetical protein